MKGSIFDQLKMNLGFGGPGYNFKDTAQGMKKRPNVRGLWISPQDYQTLCKRNPKWVRRGNPTWMWDKIRRKALGQ
jgi:ribosomal protein S6E (S10)